MRTGLSDFLIETDSRPYALLVSLVVRDACGLPVLESTPARLLNPPQPVKKSLSIDPSDWLSWWWGLLGDVASSRMRQPYTGASEQLVAVVESTAELKALFDEAELLSAEDRALRVIDEASRILAQEQNHGLHGVLHVAILPTQDSQPVFTGGVLILSHLFLETLDVADCIATLRTFARQASGG